MAEIRVGVVDVYLISPQPDDWRLLVLRRASGTRCTGAWEGVHGRIEGAESPERAALRETAEETGLVVSRLYNVCCQSFYLHAAGVVQVAVVFAAFVDAPLEPTLGPEHDAFEWLPFERGLERVIWPRSRHALCDIRALLGSGDAGPAEDVMRVR